MRTTESYLDLQRHFKLYSQFIVVSTKHPAGSSVNSATFEEIRQFWLGFTMVGYPWYSQISNSAHSLRPTQWWIQDFPAGCANSQNC